MLRKTGVLAGVTVFVTSLAGSASVAGAAPATVQSAVVGYIRIAQNNNVPSPLPRVVSTPPTPGTTWVAGGALADPNQWTCAGSGDMSSFTVSCVPVVLPVDVSYTCDLLHADVSALTDGSSGRTSMDCDGDGVPEAQTGYEVGPGGHDSVWGLSATPVTAFTCTLDLAVPNVSGGCGDPGLAGVE